MLSNLTELSSIPPMSSLLGTRGDAALIQQINRLTGSTYFGSKDDRYGRQYDSFLSKYIVPIREASRAVNLVARKLLRTDDIIWIDDIEELRELPPCMIIPTITTDPVFSLLKQGRISGYGYTADELVQKKEMYDRLIDRNGVVHLDDPDKFLNEEDKELRKELAELRGVPEEDILIFVDTEDHDDVDLTPDEVISLDRARRLMEEVVETTYLDPTDLDNIRG
jgi:hypothetical protein